MNAWYTQEDHQHYVVCVINCEHVTESTPS